MSCGPRGEFDMLMARLDPPMAVVTATDGRERGGCLVGFHAQSSMDPGRYVVWLSKANHTYRVALHSEHVAVHFLGQGDIDLAEVFGTLSGDDVDKFERVDWEPGPGSVPLLSRCPNRMVLRRVALLDEGGDHVHGRPAGPRRACGPVRSAAAGRGDLPHAGPRTRGTAPPRDPWRPWGLLYRTYVRYRKGISSYFFHLEHLSGSSAAPE